MQRLIKATVLQRVKPSLAPLLPSASPTTATHLVPPTLTTPARHVHNASNPHQNKKQLQQQVQMSTDQAQNAAQPAPDNTPITNTIFKSDNLLAYTHSHIRTQRFSPIDRSVAQLSQFDQILSRQQPVSRFGDINPSPTSGL